MAFFALVFIVIPLIELYVIVQVSHAIGVLDTIGLLLLTSLAGAWLARHEGFIVIQRVRDRLDRGELPGREMIDGLLILIGGVLLLVPGFVTDAVGVLFLFPPTRALLRMWLGHRFAVQVYGGGPDPYDGNGRIDPGGDDIIDL
jgi:UPF0716 protein FxsA